MDSESEYGSEGEEELSLGRSEGEAAGGDVDATEAAALGMDTSAPEFYDPDADERDERWVGRQRRGHRSDAVLSCPLCFTTLCVDCQQHARYENQFRAMFVMNCRILPQQVVRAPGRAPRQRKRRRQPGGAAQAAAAAAAAAAQEAEAQQGAGALQQTAAPWAADGGAGGPASSGAAGAQPQADAAAATAAAGGGLGEGGGGEEILSPVQCAACGEEVGLRDAEGLYHFFNVVASNA